MKAFILIVGIFLIIMVIPAFFSDEVKAEPKPKRRKYYNDKSSPKTLPWFDKDYLKRKRRERNNFNF